MSKKLTPSLIEAADGIGELLDTEEVKLFFQALLNHILPESDELRDLSLARLIDERERMSEEHKKWIEARVSKLKEVFQKANRIGFVKSLDLIESWGDVPF
jgi:hypothetical protein